MGVKGWGKRFGTLERRGGEAVTDFYTSAHMLERKRTDAEGRVRTVYQGVLKYREPNPQYMPDPRTPQQRRKAFGKLPNKLYEPDPRTPQQKAKTVGKQIRKVLDAKTKTAARRELEAWRERMEAEHGTPDASLTVSEYTKRYIDRRERCGELTPTTVLDYRSTAGYLKRGEAIGDLKLRELDAARVRLWETSLLDTISGTTAAKAHRLLKMVLEDAVSVDVLQANPARSVKPPRRTTGKPNALDANGRKKAMEALASCQPTPKVVAAQIALYCGLRRGEICALTWEDVDLDGGAWDDASDTGPKLRVCKAIGEGTEGMYLKEPKTEAGTRIVPLEGDLIPFLRARREAMRDEWLRCMRKAQIDEKHIREEDFLRLYVCGDVSGAYYHPTRLSKEWASTARDLGLVGTEGRIVTFHDLRHTYATNAITRGADETSVAANMGHSSPAVTLGMYASRDVAAQRSASKAVAGDLDSAARGKVLKFAPRHTGTEG